MSIVKVFALFPSVYNIMLFDRLAHKENLHVSGQCQVQPTDSCDRLSSLSVV